jgi:hypothetical protein
VRAAHIGSRCLSCGSRTPIFRPARCGACTTTVDQTVDHRRAGPHAAFGAAPAPTHFDRSPSSRVVLNEPGCLTGADAGPAGWSDEAGRANLVRLVRLAPRTVGLHVWSCPERIMSPWAPWRHTRREAGRATSYSARRRVKSGRNRGCGDAGRSSPSGDPVGPDPLPPGPGRCLADRARGPGTSHCRPSNSATTRPPHRSTGDSTPTRSRYAEQPVRNHEAVPSLSGSASHTGRAHSSGDG